MNGSQTNTLVALLAIAFVVGGSAYLVAQKQQRYSQGPQDSSAQVRQLTATVGTLIALPSEEPRVTVVADTAELHKQSYFADVAEGDRVLIFDASRKAIIYNPTEHRIVKVMDLQATPSK